MTINNQEKFYQLKCVKCGKVWDETQTTSSCLSCGAPLDAEYDYDYVKSRLNYYALKNAPISAAKYLNFYPICDLNKLISLDEGGTPLRKSKQIAKKLGLKKLYFKDETGNPTGGFKDRGTMVEITKAREMGAKAIVVASTGNMAASVSAYAAQAGIPAYVVVPEGTPLGKLSQTLSYGARIIQVRTTYSKCAKLAEVIAQRYGFYLAGDYVFRGEGQKSQGYEIIEQLFWRSPDYLIVPIGVGTNLAAIYKGMKEFYQLGLVDKLPKVVGVQVAGANAVAQAFKNGSREIKALEKINTIASAVAVNDPFDGVKVLKDVYESNGMIVEVTDEEVLKAEKELAYKESIFAEPAAALPLAALNKMKIKEDETVVCVITGNGLKDPVTVLKILPSPPSIEPKMEEVDNFLKMKLYNIQGTVEKDKVKILWPENPNKGQLAQVVEEQFNINLDNEHLDMLAIEVANFFKKGKTMVKSDLQHIIEDILKMVPDDKKVIRIEDFTVSTSKSQRAQAEVKIFIRDNKVLSIAQAEGVGPVDAIMLAAKKVVQKEKLMNYHLTDYDVKIDQRGADATVEVSMSLKDDFGNKAISTATSPDVLVASVEAFERGYNVLCNKNNNNH